MSTLALGAKPLEPFGKGSNALKAGTPDAGPLVLPQQWRLPYLGKTVNALSQPSVQPPAGGQAEKQALYAGREETQVIAHTTDGWSAGGWLP
jgi:hypothetical protein